MDWEFGFSKTLAIFLMNGLISAVYVKFISRIFKVIPRRQPESSIGQREQLSAYDIEDLKYHYDCGKFF